MNKEQTEAFEKIANKMIKFLNDNGHPHMMAIIHTDSAVLIEDIYGYFNQDYIKD